MKKHNSGRLKGTLFLIVMLPLFAIVMMGMIAQQKCKHMVGIALDKIFRIVYYPFLRFLNTHYYYYAWLTRDLADCESILELGCGPPAGFTQTISPILQIGYGFKTDAVDIFKLYVDKHNEIGSFRNCWLGDILDMEFPVKAYDAVVMFDVLEHLPADKVEQIDLLSRMESCARKKVIIFTPNGFVPNDFVDGDPYQEHVSAWEPEYYRKRGFSVWGATGARWFFGKASLPKPPQLLFYILGMLSQPLVYHFPELAWHSYAVKEIE